MTGFLLLFLMGFLVRSVFIESLLWLIVTFLSKCRFCSIRLRTGFDAQHVKNLYFVTKLQIRFHHFRGTPRSCSDQTFCKGPVSNYNMTLWTGLFGPDTQLTLLIYCLVYGPLKLAFWTPKTWLFGQNGSLDPIFGGTQIWTPKTDILTNGTDFTTL
jgi:hypothetical protein